MLAADEPFRMTVAGHREGLRGFVAEHRAVSQALVVLVIILCLVVL